MAKQSSTASQRRSRTAQIACGDTLKPNLKKPHPSLDDPLCDSLPEPTLIQSSVPNMYTNLTSTAVERLSDLRVKNFLTDCVVIFDDYEFHCHFTIISLFSEFFTAQDNRNRIIINDTGMVEDSSTFGAVMKTMYGSSLDITESNFFEIFFIAKLLKYSPLLDHCTKIQTKGLHSSTIPFSLDKRTLLDKLKVTDSAIQLKYHNLVVSTNRLLLCCYCNYFSNLWTDWATSTDPVISFNEFLRVSEESFKQFFDLIHGDKVELSSDNVYSLHYLALYFEANFLVTLCEPLLEEFFNESFIESASDLDDLMFIRKFSDRLTQMGSKRVVCVSPAAFEVISTLDVDCLWLAESLKHSWENHKVKWTGQQFDNCLKGIRCDATNIVSIFNILSDLVDDSEVELYLCRHLIRLMPILNQVLGSINDESDSEEDQLHQSDSDSSDVEVLEIENTSPKSRTVSIDKPSIPKVDGTNRITKSKKTPVTKSPNDTIATNLGFVFSLNNKAPCLSLSSDRKTVMRLSGVGERNILSDKPLTLESRDSFTWKVKYRGTPKNLFVGVIEEGKFKDSQRCGARGVRVMKNGMCKLQGILPNEEFKWTAEEVLEITVDVSNNLIVIKSVDTPRINLWRPLCSRVLSGVFYPFFTLSYSNHQIEFVD
ncbi:hypothetical protein GEMRC1_002891 [Eukaryota sp. GEM-RC1]